MISHACVAQRCRIIMCGWKGELTGTDFRDFVSDMIKSIKLAIIVVDAT